jgi:hypothetical protein
MDRGYEQLVVVHGLVITAIRGPPSSGTWDHQELSSALWRPPIIIIIVIIVTKVQTGVLGC